MVPKKGPPIYFGGLKKVSVEARAFSNIDLDSLPSELVQELDMKDGLKSDFYEIFSVMKEAGGELDLNHILIGLFKKTGKIHKRAEMIQKLFRMGRYGLVSPVKGIGKKGVYKIL